MSNTENLELGYQFDPAPSPIYASADSNNLNQVTLKVTVSNPTNGPVTLSKIEIHIPVGADIDGDLSPATNLPAPVPDTAKTPNLGITSKGSTVTIARTDGTGLTISVTAQIIFSLPGITVGTFAGKVPITITEFPVSGPKRTDATTYRLAKEQTTWPVTRFWAEPPELNNLNQTVNLKWSCNKLGSNYSYSLSAPGWQPRDCLQSGNCYDVQDGVDGITSLALTDTTEFTLTVVHVQDESRVSVGILNTTVQILQPKIRGKSPAVSFSGWVARLYWLATNASSCTVSLNGVTHDSNAPLDTWEKGYLVSVAGEGVQAFQVTAVAESGQVDVFTIPSFVTNKAQRVIAFPPDPNWPSALAIGPDAKLGLMDNLDFNPNYTYSVSVIDIEARTISPHMGIAQVFVLAISPDGKFALSATGTGPYGLDPGYVSVVDVVKRTVFPHTIPVGSMPVAIAFTPDCHLALVSNAEDNNLTAIDMTTLRPHPQTIPVGAVPIAIAITPDSHLALVSNAQDNNLTVIDMTTLKPHPQTIPIGGSGAIAITPDGTLALVACGLGTEIVVVDIPKLTARPSAIPVGKGPVSIAITPDGELALVGNSDGTLAVIDLSTLKPGSTPISTGEDPHVMAITADGRSLVIINKSGVTLL